MFRNAGLFMATIGLLALAVGCSDDDVKKKDTGGGVKLDGGGVTLDQGGGGNLDTGGGTPGTKGFGDACGGTVGCKTGFICAITQTGSKKGFCSKKCTTSGQPCTGSPSGTESYCLLSDGKGSNYCVFLCKYKGSSGPKTVPCPTGLTCGTKENPAGSGQYSCVPK